MTKFSNFKFLETSQREKSSSNYFINAQRFLKMGSKLFLILLFCLVVTTMTNCEGIDEPSLPIENYPKEVSFTEYSLDSICQWINLYDNDTIIIINNKEDLKKYINCTENNYSEIDFSKNTLLLAIGCSTSGILNITKNLQQTTREHYKLNVEIELNHYAVFDRWVITLVTNKFSENSNVELNTKNIYPTNIDVPCNCLMDTLKGDWIWVKKEEGLVGITDSTFKAIIRFLSQNTDSSINYEVFVADTFFSAGSFQIIDYSTDLYNINGFNGNVTINLPHCGWRNCDCSCGQQPNYPRNGYWTMKYFPIGGTYYPFDKETLLFHDNNFEGSIYFYEKIGKEE